MKVFFFQIQRLLFVGCLLVCGVGLAKSQDYQDYQENTPRTAPLRLRTNPAPAQVERATPVPILKQINKHNEDGSYTYGYEGADGSFKIETKLATGEVKGKYGYVDETGKVRVVEYGANKYGFQPSGEGITVAPPTLVDETAKEEPDYADEPAPQRPQKPYRINRPQSRPQSAPVPRPQPPPPQPQPQYVQYEEEEEPPRRIQYAPQPQHQPQPLPQQHQQQASLGPAPPRLQIPGAQRTTDVLYSPLQRPARPEPDYSQSQSFGDGPSNVRISRPVYALPPASPAPSSARAQGFLAPASGGRPLLEPVGFGHSQAPVPARPVQQQQPQPSYQPQPQARSGGGGAGLLDQLARDYALPQGNAQPLHDITFGYY
ncbi:tyrosine-protein phosphatase non-receptor type 23 isoform X1 [Drosophila kikkawai]|uniref:Tyrosine-protein phosphatase non-receptor type 23 isoform X1 n=1 Tax=Drosophila kikkawai TaxID=30033 RepID=A0ABM4GJS1_DROKI